MLPAVHEAQSKPAIVGHVLFSQYSGGGSRKIRDPRSSSAEE